MKLKLVALASLVLVSPALARQQQPVFRTGVNIVTLDVTVVDRDGKPVRGLTASDFVVKLEGQVRPVQTVDFIEFGNGKSRTATPAGATTPAATPATTTSRPTEPRAVVLLFDDLSLKPGDGKGMAVAAQRTLAQFGPDDLIGVAVTSALVAPVNPTRDRVSVTKAIGKLVGQAMDTTYPFVISVREADEIDRDFPKITLVSVAARECGGSGRPDDMCASQVRMAAKGYVAALKRRAAMQIEAYRTAIAAVRHFGGAKVIIVMSEGVATNVERELLQDRLDVIMRDAAGSGVRFYAMNEEPSYSDVTSAMDRPTAKKYAGDQDKNSARIESARVLFDGLASVAIAAGGQAFHVIGQADRFFTRIESETSAIYRIGVDAPVGADTQRFLDAKVSVNKPGVEVRANRKALSPNVPAEAVDIDAMLRNAVTQRGVDPAVAIGIATQIIFDDKTSQRQLGVSVQMPSNVAGPVTLMFSLVDEAGKSVQAGRKELAKTAAGQDYRFAFALPVTTPGNYSLRVAAADANRRVGRAEVPVVIPGESR